MQKGKKKMKVIEELFFGHICPNGKLMANNESYQEAIKVAIECEEKLMESLNDEQKSLLIKLQNAQSRMDGESTLEYYTEGFKLGARFGIEILDE